MKTEFEHTLMVYKRYVEIDLPTINALYEEEVEFAIMREKSALLRLQMAFHLDTWKINSWETCQLLKIKDIKKHVHELYLEGEKK